MILFIYLFYIFKLGRRLVKKINYPNHDKKITFGDWWGRNCLYVGEHLSESVQATITNIIDLVV